MPIPMYIEDTYFLGRILKYPQSGVVHSSAKQIKQLFIVQLKKRHTDRVFLDVVHLQFLKKLVKRTWDYSSKWIL